MKIAHLRNALVGFFVLALLGYAQLAMTVTDQAQRIDILEAELDKRIDDAEVRGDVEARYWIYQVAEVTETPVPSEWTAR